MKYSIVLLFFILFLNILRSQNLQGPECYTDLVTSGKLSIEKGDYGLAINQFWAAYNCNYKEGNEALKVFIKNAVKKLEQEKLIAVENAIKARENEAAAKRNEERALKAEEEAKKEKQKVLEQTSLKEAALIEAAKNGQRAEAMLLALLADNARRNGNFKEALYLSYFGIKLADPDLLADSNRAFGEAVREFNSFTILSEVGKIYEYEMLEKGNKVLVSTEQGLFIAQLNNNTFHKINTRFNSPHKFCSNPKGDQFATWSNSNKVQVWNSEGTLLGNFHDHQEPIINVVFSPAGNYLATSSRDHNISIRNLQKNSIKLLKGHTGNVYDIQFAPNEDVLLSRSADGTVRVWNIDGSIKGIIGGEELYIHHSSFSPAGNRVLTCGANGATKLWTLGGKLITSFITNGKAIRSAIYFPNNANLLTCSLDEIRVWDEVGKYFSIVSDQQVGGAVLNHTGKYLLSWTNNGDPQLTNHRGDLICKLAGHRSSIINASFSSNDNFILTTTTNGSTKLWDMDGNIIIEWPTTKTLPVVSKFSPDNQHIIIVDNDRKILEVCPFPKLIKDKIDSTISKEKSYLKELEQKYNLEFINKIKAD